MLEKREENIRMEGETVGPNTLDLGKNTKVDVADQSRIV